jgi:flagellar basal-body rod protein FlgC
MFGALDISASALTAQRVRIDTIASNIANADSTIAGVAGDGSPVPYRRLFTVFETQRAANGEMGGVRVRSIQQDSSPFIEKIEPGNPLADSRGIVKYPNVDLFVENADAMEAFRAYEANVTAIETTKSMMNATLRVLA